MEWIYIVSLSGPSRRIPLSFRKVFQKEKGAQITPWIFGNPNNLNGRTNYLVAIPSKEPLKNGAWETKPSFFSGAFNFFFFGGGGGGRVNY